LVGRGKAEAGMERRDPSFVEEIDVPKHRHFYMYCPASGNTGADNDSPYTVLTSGLACSQEAVKKATPPLC
jgi:hypothetical protein